MSRRAEQVSSTIMRELQNRLARGLADPRIKGMITITKVETTKDLKQTKAFVTVMPEDQANITMHGLKAATGRIRRDIMKRIVLKEMPSLTFVYDEGARQQRIITDLLAKDRAERGIPDEPSEIAGTETETETDPESEPTELEQ